MRKQHIEVPVKVTAWVDQGIVSLVEALNRFPDVWTVSSCQGHHGIAHVTFAFRGSGDRFAHFVGNLARRLRNRVAADNEYRISLEWMGSGDYPLCTLWVHSDFFRPVESALRGITTNGARKSPWKRGTRGTRPRNSIRCRGWRQPAR